jgi:hypothetical protein
MQASALLASFPLRLLRVQSIQYYGEKKKYVKENAKHKQKKESKRKQSLFHIYLTLVDSLSRDILSGSSRDYSGRRSAAEPPGKRKCPTKVEIAR